MKRIFSIILLFSALFLYSQELSPIFNSKNKEVNELCEKARKQMLADSDNLNALKTAEKAKQIAVLKGDPLATAKANAAIGWIFLDSKNRDAAQNFVEKAFKNIEAKDYPEAEAMLHHQLGIILDEKSEPKKALEHYLKAVKYYTEIKDYFRQTQVYNEISRLYLVTGDQDSFSKYFKLTSELLKIHPNNRLQLNYNNQKNYVLMSERKLDEAYNLNMRSVEIAKEINEKKIAISPITMRPALCLNRAKYRKPIP